MLTLELVPGRSLGLFRLGMPIREAIAMIQRPGSMIKAVDFKYSDKQPLEHDVVLDLRDDGVQLHFDSALQVLVLVEVYDVQRVCVTYRSKSLCQRGQVPSFAGVYELLGPSYPGQYDADKLVYLLQYPGVSFSFPIPQQYSSLYRDSTELPLELPDGSSPATSRVCVFRGQSLAEREAPDASASEEIHAKLFDGITFTRADRSIQFGAGVQDVLSDIGAPSSVFHKTDDKMQIHALMSRGNHGSSSSDDEASARVSGSGNSSSGVGSSGAECRDYLYNYYHLGLDILFDGATHTVKKFVLHTNFPGHYDFNLYNKCNFRLPISVEAPQNSDAAPDLLTGGAARGITFTLVQPDARWDDIHAVLGDAGAPVVYNRGTGANPFGVTFFYGYDGVIFEVMKNGHIATVILYNERHGSGSIVGS